MPNFGKLTQDLIGGSLTIGDKLVIDSHLNLHIGNVYGGNIKGTLYTSHIVEENSMQGIQVLGNVNIASGYFLTGDLQIADATVTNLHVTNNATIGQTLHVLSVTGLTSGLGPDIVGNTNLTGSLFVSGPELTVPHLASDTISVDALMTNTIAAKIGTQIEILGNLRILESDAVIYVDTLKSESAPGITAPVIMGNLTITGPQLFVPHIVTTLLSGPSGSVEVTSNVLVDVPHYIAAQHIYSDELSAKTGGGSIVVTSNVEILHGCLIDGCLTLGKSSPPTTITNVVQTYTSAGHITYYNQTMFNFFEEKTMTMENPCVKASSIVFGQVINYTGVGGPIVNKVHIFDGYVDFSLLNLGNTMPIADTVVIQYLVL